MNSAFSTAIPDPSLAATRQLSENSRLGFASRNPALHQGFEWSKSTLALGLPEWSGKTASDHVVAANNGPIVPANPCNRAGNAPDPSVYQAKGQAASTNAIADFWNIFQFHGHGTNDAQQSGASPAYANYVYGVYMGAAGYTLDQTLSGAELYAEFKTKVYGPYPANVPLDAPNYPFTPVSNVMNITYGFNAQQTRTICHK